jgi:hypothetical protein
MVVILMYPLRPTVALIPPRRARSTIALARLGAPLARSRTVRVIRPLEIANEASRASNTTAPDVDHLHPTGIAP